MSGDDAQAYHFQRLLLGHRRTQTATKRPICLCGEAAFSLDDHLRHLAEVLAADVAAQVREARRQEWNNVHGRYCPYTDSCGHVNPYAAPSAATGREDEVCPQWCLNRLAPHCVIHRPAGDEGR